MIALYQEKTAWGNETCKSPSLFCPSLCSSDIRLLPVFSTAIGHHTACLCWQSVNATRPLGECVLCTETLYDDFEWNYSRLRICRADWWYCGGKALRSTLPLTWRAPLHLLIQPFHSPCHLKKKAPVLLGEIGEVQEYHLTEGCVYKFYWFT